MISGFQPNAFQNNAFQIGADAPTPPVAPVGGGVKRRPRVIRLSDVDDRESVSDFIKSHLAKYSPPVPVAEPKIVYKSGKRDAKAIELERLAELAMRNMEIEAENEIRNEYNRKMMMLLLIAAEDE